MDTEAKIFGPGVYTQYDLELIRKSYLANKPKGYVYNKDTFVDISCYDLQYHQNESMLTISELDSKDLMMRTVKACVIHRYTCSQMNILYNWGFSEQQLIHMKLSGEKAPYGKQRLIRMTLEKFVGEHFSFIVDA